MQPPLWLAAKRDLRSDDVLGPNATAKTWTKATLKVRPASVDLAAAARVREAAPFAI